MSSSASPNEYGPDGTPITPEDKNPFTRVYKTQTVTIALVAVTFVLVLICLALLIWILFKLNKPCCCPIMGLNIAATPLTMTAEQGTAQPGVGSAIKGLTTDTKIDRTDKGLSDSEPVHDPSESIYIVQLSNDVVTPELQNGRVPAEQWIRHWAERFHVKPVAIYTEALYGFAARMTPEIASAISEQRQIVEQVAADFLVKSCAHGDDEKESSNLVSSTATLAAASVGALAAVRAVGPSGPLQWGMDRLGLMNREKSFLPSSEQVIVYVLDSGIDSERGSAGLNLIKSVSTVWWEPSDQVEDRTGHGTHAAGIIGSSIPGLSGVVPNTKLISIRVLDSLNRGSVTSVLSGIDAVFRLSKELKPKAQVVHLGFGVPVLSQDLNILDTTVEELILAKIAVVAPAGNENGSVEKFSPAHTPNVISVGAYDMHNQRSLWTNTGPQTLLAPGENVVSLLPQSKTGIFSGSSIATAYATGLIVLTLASMTSDELSSQAASPEALLQALILKSSDAGTGVNPPINNVPKSHYHRSVYA